MQRFGLRDDQWERIKDLLPGREGHVGGNAADNRLFVDAVLYRYRTGVPWRDLPARFRSHFQVVGDRRRQRIHDDRHLYRARSPAQFWRSKKNGPQAIGRSRGGLTTKIHALVDALGNPVELMLTPDIVAKVPNCPVLIFLL